MRIGGVWNGLPFPSCLCVKSMSTGVGCGSGAGPVLRWGEVQMAGSPGGREKPREHGGGGSRVDLEAHSGSQLDKFIQDVSGQRSRTRREPVFVEAVGSCEGSRPGSGQEVGRWRRSDQGLALVHVCLWGFKDQVGK